MRCPVLRSHGSANAAPSAAFRRTSSGSTRLWPYLLPTPCPRCATPGTDIGYAATHVLCAMSGTWHSLALSCYASAMRCPVLT
eukprot:746570-Rhodomonas_salina.2